MGIYIRKIIDRRGEGYENDALYEISFDWTNCDEIFLATEGDIDKMFKEFERLKKVKVD